MSVEWARVDEQNIGIEDVDNAILPLSMVCVVRYCFDWSQSTTYLQLRR